MYIKRLFLFYALVVISTANNVIDSNRLFAAKLYQALGINQMNMVYSPFTIHSQLALLYQWSAGHTEETIRNSLELPDKMSTTDQYNRILPSLIDAPNITLKMASKIYLNAGKQPAAGRKVELRSVFHAEVDYLDFRDTVRAASAVNSWFRWNTAGKIDDLVTAKDFSRHTFGVLLNAMYIKGEWLSKFDPANTEVLPFFMDAKGRKVLTPMMQKVGTFYYGELGAKGSYDAQILRLRFRDRRYSLNIILPVPWRTIEDIEKILTDMDLHKINSLLKEESVRVSLPRFKIEGKYDLIPPLGKIGLTAIFAANARFPYFTDSYEPVIITKILQKATIEVNEEGGEASVASATAMLHRSRMGVDPVLFIANHPFLFTVTAGIGPEDNGTYTNDITVFMGKVTTPEIVQSDE